jgi:hypothetical protein
MSTSRGSTVRVLLACAASLGVARGTAVLASPSAGPRNPLEEVRRSTVGLWTNFQACQTIRKERKAGALVDYNMHYTLKRGVADRGKLIQLVWIASAAKWSTPLIAYFFPAMLPSTFETAAARAARLDASAALRRTAMLQLLQKADAGKLDQQKVLAVLSAGSKSKALADLNATQAPLKSLPLPVVHAASKALAGPPRFLPRLMHMQAIRGALRAMEEGDTALRATTLAHIPRSTLVEACSERAIDVGRGADVGKLCSSIDEWLSLTATADKAGPDAAQTTRLALYAINTLSATRRAMQTNAPALHALHTKGGF